MSVKSSWNVSSKATFTERLQKKLGRPVFVRFNQNRKVYLSHRQEIFGGISLSLHEAFLGAPQELFEALVCYLKGRGEKKKRALSHLKRFFFENVSQKREIKSSLKTEEVSFSHHCIQSYFNEIQENYYATPLNLSIRWFGAIREKSRSQFTFGLYDDSLKLVKIHKMLDNPLVPDYFVKFVIFHEMVHAEIPSYYDASGRLRMHGPEFKKRERQFKEYKQAIEWQKANRHLFFQTAAQLKRGR